MELTLLKMTLILSVNCLLFSRIFGQPTIQTCNFKDCSVTDDTVITYINILKVELEGMKHNQKIMQDQMVSLQADMTALKEMVTASSLPSTERTTPIKTTSKRTKPQIVTTTTTTTRSTSTEIGATTSDPLFTSPRPHVCPSRECAINNGGCGSGTCHDEFHDSYRCASQCSQTALDIVLYAFAEDANGGGGFDVQKKFLQDFIRSFTVGNSHVRVGMLTSKSSYTEVAFNLNTYNDQQSILDAINAVDFNGRWHARENILIPTIEGMFTKINGDRKDVKNILIYIQDFYYNDNLTYVGYSLYSQDITVYAISVHYKRDRRTEQEVIQIASPPKLENQSYFLAETYNDLPEILLLLQSSICSNKPCIDSYNSSYCSWTNKPLGSKSCRKIGSCHSEKVDLVFVIYTKNKWLAKTYTNFVISILDNLRLSQQNTRIGFVKSYDVLTSENIFFLNSHNEQVDLYRSIRNITETTSQGYVYWTASYKQVLAQFSALNGNRSEARDYVIVLADEYSDSVKNIQDTSEEFLQKGGRILSVAIKDRFQFDEAKPQAISTHPRIRGQDYFVATSYTSLFDDIKWKLLDEICGGGSKEVECRETEHAGRQCFCHIGECTMTQIYN